MERNATARLSLLARWAVVYPACGALLLLVAASLFPMRLDRRNFQDLARADGLGLPRGTPYVFVSQGASVEAYRFAHHVLAGLAYPAPDWRWVVLRAPGVTAGQAPVLDAEGALSRATPGAQAELRPDDLATYVDRGVLLYDDAQARRGAEERAAWLAAAPRVYVLRPFQPAGYARRPPANELTPLRCVRLTALCGLPFTLFAAWRRRLAMAGAFGVALAAGLALWSAPPLWIWWLSWSELTPLRAPGIWPYAAWAAAAAWLWAEARRRTHADQPEAPVAGDAGARRWIAPSVVWVAACYLALTLVRLDFDEDAHAHWMLMARSYYTLGQHVPEQLRGHLLSATYPYGFAALLSLGSWSASLPSDAGLGLSAATHTALFVYRVMLAALGFGFLLLVAASLRHGAGGRGWIAGPALLLALFPVLQGRHLGAETWLVPMLGGVVALLMMWQRGAEASLALPALFVGGVATLIKLEGGLLLTVVALPWLAGPRAARFVRQRAAVVGLAAILLGLLPALTWRLQLSVPNPLYRPPTWSALQAALPEAPAVYAHCLLIILREGLAPLLAALPVALLARLSSAHDWRAALAAAVVPLSIAAAVLGLPLLYLFSTLPRVAQIEASFTRLLVLPMTSALLYLLETFITAEGPER